MYFQELILTLQRYWHGQGCVLTQPYDVEKGAGTFNPTTFLRALGPEPFNAAYVEPCRRPTDGRYGDNPIRMQHYYQFQVVMKPSPPNIVELYLGSLRAIGIRPEEHDIRFVHDDWESPTLGAWGLGWEVWADGMEITQFTYFQQVGGIELPVVMGEITYGLERICMFLQNVDSVFDIRYNDTVSYGDLFHENEVQCSRHNFEIADVALHTDLFARCEAECGRLCAAGAPLPAADYCLKASHSFNLLDARGAISVSERQNYILRVRHLARQVAEAWVINRENLGFPLGAAAPAAGANPALPAAPAAGSERVPLLIELGVEEMPARVFKPLLRDLPRLFDKHIAATGIEPEGVRFFLTPRRIAVSVASVATRQPDRVVEQKGPPLRIARDDDGNWTKAAIGFAARNGLAPDDLDVRELKGQPYLFACTEEKGRCAAELLADAIPDFFNAIHWYKTMRWGTGGCSFVRPVQWLVALLGGDALPCTFAGVTAGRTTWGHRFLAAAPVQLADADRDGYLERLRAAHVIADHDERRELIRARVIKLAEEDHLQWREDEELLHEISFLVEYPVPLFCRFSEQYLQIPEAVLVSEMKEHQRYLALAQDDGRLANAFIAVSNMLCTAPEVVCNGYEKVLKSRFADAEFFLREDMKKSLADRVPALERMVFQADLGTYRDKIERLGNLSAYLCAELGLTAEATAAVDQIARLCKADLTTSMVCEFPQLQGEIGGYYATAEGLPPAVAAGIREHYLPRGAADALPTQPEAAVVGIVDRMDTLSGIFSLGRAPTGSADPFALRRACLTSIALILRHDFQFDLRDLLQRCLELHSERLPALDVKARAAEILDFYRQRARGLFQDQGREGVPGDFAWDTIDAVMQAEQPWTCLADLVKRLEAMREFRRRDDFDDVAATFKRANNILRELTFPAAAVVDAKLFVDAEEGALAAAVAETARRMDAHLAAAAYVRALAEIVPLRAVVDDFFDAVLVNDPDAGRRRNRRLLLRQVVTLVRQVADFSAIQG